MQNMGFLVLAHPMLLLFDFVFFGFFVFLFVVDVVVLDTGSAFIAKIN